ncbi:ABC transporter permease [Gordonia shandongensis]|uniref:ABC transporter permease n=1 Tax=Gordonia shandongensis TaxID=376351 RepID=UPI000405E771|nr:ABC transporter permease [Gordonia shandongensis]
MSTAYVTVDTTAAPIPLSRLTRVELRKLVDTRAGFWLIASMGLIAVLIGVIMLIANRNNPEDLTFDNFFMLMNQPTAFLLPVMAILLVTSEWSQRTALATFTMEPRRERIIAAKLIASVIAALGAVLAAAVVGAVATVIAQLTTSTSDAWSVSGLSILYAVVLQLAGLLLGFAFAAAFLNTPIAIVIYFVLPSIFTLAGNIIPWFRENLIDWISTDMTMIPFQDGGTADGGDWLRFLVAYGLWIGVPLTFGIVRIMRSEVK